MPELSWRHHTLIQALLSRGPLKEDQFHRIFKGLTGKTPGTHQQLFDDYLLQINKQLSSLQFELRACRFQYDGNVYYGLVNTVSDEQSKLGTKYSLPQIAFYKAVIEAIVQDATAQGSISNTEALNLRLENQEGHGNYAPALRNFSITQKETALNEFVQDQWLNLTLEGNIVLGIRSFLDLRSWFRSNDVPSCEVCNEAGVKAELCQNEACTVRIHKYCLMKMFSERKGRRVCPSCGTQWKYDGPKVELIEQDDEPNVPTQSQQPPVPKRKRQRAKNVIESGSSQITQPSSDLTRVTRSRSRAR